MSSSDSNVFDFALVERCLGHEVEALTTLQESYRAPISAFLIKSGANEAETQETVATLWSDLLSPASTGRIRLSRYDGSCALLTWLNTVALNALLTRKRTDRRRERRFPSSDVETHGEPSAEDTIGEQPLIELIREAVGAAFQHIPAEDFVLLQLEYLDQLDRDELARMFGCSKSTVSRRLETARLSIAESTLARVRQRDPWLELRWEDFLELCQTATPACFGINP